MNIFFYTRMFLYFFKANFQRRRNFKTTIETRNADITLYNIDISTSLNHSIDIESVTSYKKKKKCNY